MIFTASQLKPMPDLLSKFRIFEMYFLRFADQLRDGSFAFELDDRGHLHIELTCEACEFLQDGRIDGLRLETETYGAPDLDRLAQTTVGVGRTSLPVAQPDGGKSVGGRRFRGNLDFQVVAETARRDQKVRQRRAAANGAFPAVPIHHHHAARGVLLQPQ